MTAARRLIVLRAQHQEFDIGCQPRIRRHRRQAQALQFSQRLGVLATAAQTCNATQGHQGARLVAQGQGIQRTQRVARRMPVAHGGKTIGQQQVVQRLTEHSLIGVAGNARVRPDGSDRWLPAFTVNRPTDFGVRLKSPRPDRCPARLADDGKRRASMLVRKLGKTAKQPAQLRAVETRTLPPCRQTALQQRLVQATAACLQHKRQHRRLPAPGQPHDRFFIYQNGIGVLIYADRHHRLHPCDPRLAAR